MRSLIVCVILLLLAFLGVESTVVSLNSTSTCVLEGACSFSDASAWEGGIVPASGDSVLIIAKDVVKVTLDSTTPQGNNVTFKTLQTYNTLLLVEQISLTVSESLTIDGSSTISITNCSANVRTVQAYGLISVKGSIISSYIFNARNLTLIDSSLSSSNFGNTVYPTVNATNSILNVLYILYANSLYAQGNVTFNNAAVMSITNDALFKDVPYLHLTAITLAYGSLQIIDSVSNITSINTHNSVTFSNTHPTSHFLGNLNTNGHTLNIGEDVSLTLGTASATGNYLNMEPYSSLYVTGSGASFTAQEIAATASINVTGVMTGSGDFSNVYLAPHALFFVYRSILFETTNGTCGLSGPGSLILADYKLTCEGTLSVGSVSISAIMDVPALETTSINAISGTVEGDVETNNLIFNYYRHSLTVEGDYIQSNGYINISTTTFDFEVEGSVTLSGVTVYLNIDNYFDAVTERIIFAECEKFSVHSSGIVDLSDAKRKLTFIVEEETVYIILDENYFQRNWQMLIVVGGLSFLVLLFLILICKNDNAFESMEKNDPHPTISEYFGSMTTKNVSACTWVWFIPLFLVFLPFFLEAAVLTIILAVFIPLGFLMGLIEHKLVFMWAVIVLCIQAGGLLDLFADISLVAKFFIYYFDHTFGIHNPRDSEITNAEDLTWVRLALTLGGSLVCLIFLFLLTSGFGTMLDTLTGKKNFSKSMPKLNLSSGVPAMLILIMIWKVVLMTFRVAMLYSVAKSLITKRRLEEHIQRRIQWIEIILFFDLVWSGIPLGVLTAMELLYYNHEDHLTGETIFELLKMGALAVDLVGFSFLIYYVVFGLMYKIPCLHHKHEGHHEHDKHEKHNKHDEHHKNQEHEPVGPTKYSERSLLIQHERPNSEH